MGRSKSSHRWMQEHFNDEYVKLAQAKGYRSRAVFKLIEIQEKDKLFRAGMNVIDLGAAPGGWSEYVRGMLAKNDKVIALDMLVMQEIPGVEFIAGDFREDTVLAKVNQLLDGALAHAVLSDMAPNISGNREVDQPRMIYLAELALDLARVVLAKNGVFLVKVFQGEGSDEFLGQVRQHFSTVLIRKPKASRPRSKEIYVLGKGFKF